MFRLNHGQKIAYPTLGYIQYMMRQYYLYIYGSRYIFTSLHTRFIQLTQVSLGKGVEGMRKDRMTGV